MSSTVDMLEAAGVIRCQRCGQQAAGFVERVVNRWDPLCETCAEAYRRHRVWSAMESAAWEQQSDRIRDQDMFMKGYEKGVEDVKHGRHGMSSDAEGLCYTMLTQEQARRFLDELTKMRVERP